MQNVLGLDDPNDRSGTKLVKILSSKAISDCIQDGYLSVKDKPFPCFKENIISGFLAFVSKNPICFSDGSVSS